MKTKLPAAIKEFFQREGSKGGKKGGKSRMASLTPQQRSELGKKAAAARWKNTKKKPAKSE